MTIMDIVALLFLAMAVVSVCIGYVEVGASVQRALDARFRGRALVLMGFLALVWPVTLPALTLRDLVQRDHAHALLMGKEVWASKVWAQEGAKQLGEEAEIRRIHAEWQSRVNYFYALGAEAEKTQDLLTASHIAENLDFLLETEPPRPPEKVKAKPVAKKPVPDQKDLRARIDRKAEIFLHETQPSREDRLGFCNVCARQLERDRFQRYLVAGICDTCYDDTHEGTM